MRDLGIIRYLCDPSNYRHVGKYISFVPNTFLSSFEGYYNGATENDQTSGGPHYARLNSAAFIRFGNDFSLEFIVTGIRN